MAAQYLESLDSVRTVPAGGDSTEDARIAELQTFLEVLTALALGREIVVPQSYAFDSGAFLTVAEIVLNARQQASPESKDRPFRPHLHTVSTFDAALRSMIGRVRDEQRPFHSSLHPRLNRMSPSELTDLLDDLDGLTQLVGDDYAGPLAQVRREFSLTPAHEVYGTPTGLRLATFLRDFVTPTSAVSRQADGLRGGQRDVHRRLVTALRKLTPEEPAAFGQRSRLRQDVRWPNDPGRTAEQIVGTDDIGLVREFVDTLYNREIVDSMGTPLALYSTDASPDPDAREARLLAQEFALGRPPLLADDHDELPPYFRIEQLQQGSRRSGKLGRDVEELFDRGSKGLVPLMAARADRRGDFWRRIGAIEEAAASGDRQAYEERLDAHLRVVTKEIGSVVRFTWRSDLGVDAGVTLGEGLVGLFNPAGVVGLMLSAGAFVAPYAIKGGVKAGRGRGSRRRLTAALSSVVPPPPGLRR
jgi:hypothetical protein